MAQKLTHEILIAAIAGFEAQKIGIDSRIAELRGMLDGGGNGEPTAPTATAKPRKKRSAAVRKKMALAQKARYAKLKKASEPAPAAQPKKRKLSAAGRKAIVEATKRRWAAIRAAKKSGVAWVAKSKAS